MRVLKFDGAIAPRVLKFDSGSAAEGCGGRLILLKAPSYEKTFTTALRASENRPTALAGEGDSPFGALRHHLPAPVGSVSHDSQVALLSYESCSLATAERWDNKALKSSPFTSSSQHNGAL